MLFIPNPFRSAKKWNGSPAPASGSAPFAPGSQFTECITNVVHGWVENQVQLTIVSSIFTNPLLLEPSGTRLYAQLSQSKALVLELLFSPPTTTKAATPRYCLSLSLPQPSPLPRSPRSPYRVRVRVSKASIRAWEGERGGEHDAGSPEEAGSAHALRHRPHRAQHDRWSISRSLPFVRFPCFDPRLGVLIPEFVGLIIISGILMSV